MPPVALALTAVVVVGAASAQPAAPPPGGGATPLASGGAGPAAGAAPSASASALAATGSASVASPPVAASSSPAPTGALCREHVPSGKERPSLTESFPPRGLAGHVASLRLEVEHGSGETVLPDGFRLENSGDQLLALEAAGFVIPDPSGTAAPLLQRSEAGGKVTTRVEIPLVPLPPKPGRHELTLPALPIAIARASGDLMTVCTSPHGIVVEDPTASADAPPPRPNPPPERQLEEWTWLKHAAIASAVALPLGLLLGWLAVRWWRRPRRVPPPPPPRPPWEVAFEAFAELRRSELLAEGRFVEYLDRVSYSLRWYLGHRYGFDGLENTTYETLVALRSITPAVVALPDIQRCLRDADLVKFAKLVPDADECEAALVAAERIVAETRPPPEAAPSAPPGPNAASARKASAKKRPRPKRARREP